jgi:heterotetrameric sarcosine oxidase gamma subunit
MATSKSKFACRASSIRKGSGCVPDIELGARSGLEQLVVPGRIGAPDGGAGVTLALRAGVALASVMVRKGRQDQLAQRMRDAFGLELPASPRRIRAGPIAFAWAGPGHWLAMAEGVAGDAFERRLRHDLAGLASACDQSDGRTLIRVGGTRARDALAKGVMIDLHPRAFGPGDAAVTDVAHISVHVWQLDAAPNYEFAVFRSLAAEFWCWIVESGAEFGVAVEAAD